MMYKRVICALAVLFCSSQAGAEIERIAIPGEQGMKLFWWPKLPSIVGWQQDRDFSFRYGANALAPFGKSFADADTVMYAKATFKPRVPDTKSMESFIENDKKNFAQNVPSIKIENAPPLTSAEGRKLMSLTYTPNGKGNWERVAYLEEGEFFLVFTISSRTATGLKSSMSAYEAMVSRYREKPETATQLNPLATN